MPPIQSKVKQKDALAKVHLKNISAFFRTQKAMVMQALTRRTLSAPARALESPPVGISTEEWDKLWKNIVTRTTPELTKIIASAEADALHAGAIFGEKSIGSFTKGNGQTFNLANPRAVAWFQQNGGSVDYIKGIQQTTSNQIKGIITNALDKGQAYTITAREIQDSFDGMSRERATNIAVFETGNAYEQGNMLFAQSLKDDGVEMEKSWQTSDDGDQCDICQGNQDEGWIPIDQAHQSGHQQPEAHLRCRCYEIYQQAQGE